MKEMDNYKTFSLLLHFALLAYSVNFGAYNLAIFDLQSLVRRGRTLTCDAQSLEHRSKIPSVLRNRLATRFRSAVVVSALMFTSEFRAASMNADNCFAQEVCVLD